MATRTFTITQSGLSRNFTIASGVGATGATGATGSQGATGSPGPNSVTASTTSDINGILAADGANVQLATSAQKLALPVSTAQAAADAVVLAAAIQRANHTGTQTLSTISDAGTAAAAATGDFTPIAHASNTANPHTVTKAQVGLGSADNTSDASKPVSTAQAAADAVVLAAVPAEVNAMTTLTGAKTFSGQVEATGQAATTDDSVITRSLADTRYPMRGYATAATTFTATGTGSTGGDTLTTLTLPEAGTYSIDVDVSLKNNETSASITAYCRVSCVNMWAGKSLYYKHQSSAAANIAAVGSITQYALTLSTVTTGSPNFRRAGGKYTAIIKATGSTVVTIRGAHSSAPAIASDIEVYASYLRLD